MMNSDDNPNVDMQISPINNATDNSIRHERRIPALRHPLQRRSFADRDPYTNYATFADLVNGQTYPRQATMDSGGASIVVEYQVGENVGAKFIFADRGYDNECTNDSDRTPFGITQTHYIQNHDEQQIELQFNGAAGSKSA